MKTTPIGIVGRGLPGQRKSPVFAIAWGEGGRGTIKKIADKLDYEIAATLEDPEVLDDIKAVLASIKSRQS